MCFLLVFKVLKHSKYQQFWSLDKYIIYWVAVFQEKKQNLMDK